MRRVSPSEANTLLRTQGYVCIDVRSEPELASGVIAGSFHVPLLLPTSDGMELNRDFVRVMRARFALTQKLVVSCETGVRSLRAATLLTEQGFVDVVDQRAGMSGAKDAFGRVIEPGWRAAGLPIDERVASDHDYGALLSHCMKAT